MGELTSSYRCTLCLETKKNPCTHNREMENEVRKVMMEVDREEEDDQDEDSFDTDEEEFSPKRPAGVSPPGKGRISKKLTAVAVRVVEPKKKGNKKTTSAKNGATSSKRSVQSAFAALAKKVLDSSETPENSLVAALLESGMLKSSTTTTKTSTVGSSSSRSFASQPPTMYTTHLETVARTLLQDHPDASSLHIQLLNMLFRSVGGNLESNLPEDIDLEDMDDTQWGEQVTKVVDVMRESETALLTVAQEDKIGVREYRAIYQEFWYRLGIVILSHNANNNNNNASPGSDDTDPDPPSQTFHSNRFQVELMRDLVSRVTELVMVGQPDLRAASTTAVWELTKASIERTVELTTKLETAQRQYAASKGQSRKLQALQNSMDSWKRHKAELEALVEEAVIQGVFINRYRDSNPNIRRESLETLRHLILARPDMFLKGMSSLKVFRFQNSLVPFDDLSRAVLILFVDKYLKYLGWMASDKDATVRLASLKGLLAPFKYKHDKRPETLQLKLEDMQNVCNKFLPRIAECTNDAQSLEVQEVAMELIVKLTSEGFMDDFDDDDAWDQLNLKALDVESTPGVRKNALYLVLDQLDVFDDGDGRSSVGGDGTLSERQQIARINGIAQWYVVVLFFALYRDKDFSCYWPTGWHIIWLPVWFHRTRSKSKGQTTSYNRYGRCQSTRPLPRVGQRSSRRFESKTRESPSSLMKRPKISSCYDSWSVQPNLKSMKRVGRPTHRNESVTWLSQIK